MRSSSAPRAVRKMIGTGVEARIRSNTSRPSIPGSITSSTTRSGGEARARSSAAGHEEPGPAISKPPDGDGRGGPQGEGQRPEVPHPEVVLRPSTSCAVEVLPVSLGQPSGPPEAEPGEGEANGGSGGDANHDRPQRAPVERHQDRDDPQKHQAVGE